MKLNELYENPENPSKATDAEIERLKGKLERIPDGLKAMRIAYVTDAPTGGKMVISGNKRLRVLKSLYGDDHDLPDEYFCDVTGMTHEQRREFLVNANISDGSWDLDKLLDQYDKSELDKLMGTETIDELIKIANTKYDTKNNKYQNHPDAVPEVNEICDSVKGQVYSLGRHTLMCGDSTNSGDVEKLMCGELADCVITDPPYNIDVQGCTKDRLKIKNDNMADDEFYKFLNSTFKNAYENCMKGAPIYVWHADAAAGNNPSVYFYNSMVQNGWHVSNTLIWVKNHFTFSMGRNDFNRKHEPCLYGWKTGKTHQFYGPINLTTTIDDGRPDFSKMTKKELVDFLEKTYSDETPSTVIYADKPQRNALHPTMKPVNLIEKQINWSTAKNDRILDLFAGSGTTFIACENTGRICYGMEFDPHYCDVVRKRYAEYVHGEGCDWRSLTPAMD